MENLGAVVCELRRFANVEELKKMRELPDKLGVTIDLLTPPNLASSHIDRERNPGIMLGKSPERDREIDSINQMIRNAAKAGIPMLKYNMSIQGVVRTKSTPGRGGCIYSTFDLSKAANKDQLTEAGPVSEEQASGPHHVFFEASPWRRRTK